MACGLGFPSKTPWPPKSASSTMFEALRLVICCDVGSSLDMTLAISEWSLSHPQTLNVMSFPCFLKSLHIPFLGSNTNSCGAEKIEGRAATLELFRKERKQISKILKFPDCVLFFQHFYALWNLIQIATAHGSKNHIRPTSKWQHNLRSSGSQCYERQTCNTFDTFQAICKHPCQKGDNLITCHHEGSGCCQPLAFVITTPK